MRAIAEFATFDEDFIPQLKKHLVGKKIRAITKHRITLTDGTELWLCDDWECCASDQLTANELDLDNDAVITDVAMTGLELVRNPDGYIEGTEPKTVTLTILGQAKWERNSVIRLGEIVEEYDPGSGWYCVVAHVEVYAPSVEGEQEPDVHWDAFTPLEEAGE